MIVIDAGVAIAWFLERPGDIAQKALDAVVAEGGIVPSLWRWEVQDVLRRLAIADRLTRNVDYIRDQLRELPITFDDNVTRLFGAEARVASRFGLSVYDAAYLELALRLHVPLATADAALIAAARIANLPDPG